MIRGLDEADLFDQLVGRMMTLSIVVVVGYAEEEASRQMYLYSSCHRLWVLRHDWVRGGQEA
jgi:hypothetical protein